jgi:TolB protein
MIKASLGFFRTAVFAWIIIVTGFCSALAEEYDYINISEPFLQKIPLAVPVFMQLSGAQEEKPIAESAAGQLAEALAFTGYFKTIDPGAFLEEPSEKGIVAEAINFKNWRDIGAELLITGGVRYEAGVLQMEFRLFDPFRAELLVGKRYTGPPGDQRRMVLRFAGEMIQRLTDRQGLFNSRIAFVGENENGRCLYICDFDGKNIIQITEPQPIVLSPAWRPDGKALAYTAYTDDKPEIYLVDTDSRRVSKFTSFEGINITPEWMRDGSGLAVTLSFQGDEEIYLLTREGKVDKRLTNSWGVDVSPSFSPDGKQMVFVSSRSGSPQLYIKDISSGRIKRLTYEGQYNTQPDWSPSGDKIAYSGMKDGRIDIYVIDNNTGEISQLTGQAGDNESPSWSPDGSMIVFSSTRSGPGRLYVMTATGTDQRRLLEMEGRQLLPDWSPAGND